MDYCVLGNELHAAHKMMDKMNVSNKMTDCSYV